MSKPCFCEWLRIHQYLGVEDRHLVMGSAASMGDALELACAHAMLHGDGFCYCADNRAVHITDDCVYLLWDGPMAWYADIVQVQRRAVKVYRWALEGGDKFGGSGLGRPQYSMYRFYAPLFLSGFSQCEAQCCWCET